MEKLAGRTAMVTGGGSGIGEAIVRALAREGAAVAVLDIDETCAEGVASELSSGLAVGCDVADAASVDAAVERVVQELGGLDILVNNAGISGEEETLATIPRAEAQLGETASGRIATALDVVARLTDEQWRRMLAVHLDGTFYCTRSALRYMVPRRSGVIINMASIFGLVGGALSPHYSAAKAGILGFTRAVAKDAIIHGIRVNAIAPGVIDTPLISALTPALRATIALQTPQGRFGTVEEVAATAVFLASDDASFFVGETLSPNGGLVTV